jgi:CubicO group peptidase (beta-lactamase class C family)
MTSMKYLVSVVFVGTFLSILLLTLGNCGGQRQSVNNNEGLVPLAQKTSPQPPDTRSETQSTYDFTAVDTLLEQATPQLDGCALLLIKDGTVIYRKTFGGYALDKVVPIASASKWLSGAVIMALTDEGKLSLDDPVSKYLPEFSGDKAGITIRQLFSHTSGLPPEAGCRNDKRTTLERCANEIARLKLRANPGEQFYYGGAAMHVGGRIAEIVSGRSWNELFTDKIASSLGMAKTDFLAYGPTANPRPEGDARSSLDDYARFLQMILNEGRFNGQTILSRAAVTEMHKDQTNSARIAYTIYEKHGDLDPTLLRARYGIGVWREKVDERTGELLEASSQGALGFTPWIDVKRNLAGVLSVQSSMSRVMPVYLRLKDEIRRVVPAGQNDSFLH